MLRLSDALGLELKRGIAERYFGFRKLIEEDKLALEESLKQHSVILQKRICFELLRIYLLLRHESLILSFLEACGLDRAVFYDPQLAHLAGCEPRLFQGLRQHGITRFGRFRNLLFDAYGRLTIHVRQYSGKTAEIVEMKKLIDEEIRQFHSQNDLGVILGFIKMLGNPPPASSLEGDLEIGLSETLAGRMRIEEPRPIEHCLPVIAPLPPLAMSRGFLKKLARQAFASHGKELLNSWPATAAAERR